MPSFENLYSDISLAKKQAFGAMLLAKKLTIKVA